jgi:hypothetical protein
VAVKNPFNRSPYGRPMKKQAPLAILIAIAAALPTGCADAEDLPNRAQFKVRITGSQGITWNENLEVHSGSRCDSVYAQNGNGSSGLEMHSDGWQPVVAKRAGGRVTFSFDGRPDTPISGHLEREGVSQSKEITPPSDPNACPKPGRQSAPDCGERDIPADARLALEWATPSDWPDHEGPTPLVPSLFLVGPYGRDPLELREAMSFEGCPGIAEDYMFGVNTERGYDTGSAALPVATIFGTKASFQLDGRLAHTTNLRLPPEATGASTIHTQLRWKVQFKRVHRAVPAIHRRRAR